MAQQGHNAFGGANDDEMDDYFDFEEASGVSGAQLPPLQGDSAGTVTAAPQQLFQGGTSSPTTVAQFSAPQGDLAANGTAIPQQMFQANASTLAAVPFSTSFDGSGHPPPLRQTSLQPPGQGPRFVAPPRVSTPGTYPAPPELTTQFPGQILTVMASTSSRPQQRFTYAQVLARPPGYPTQSAGAGPSAVTPSTAGSGPVPSSWDPAIASFKNATAWLAGKNFLYLRITVKNDNIAAVEANAVQWAEKIFNALALRPTSPPNTVSQQDHKKWQDQQDRARAMCEKNLQKARDIKDARAQSLLVVGRVLKLHKEGISIKHLDDDSARRVNENGNVEGKGPGIKMKKSKYLLDRFMTCSTRLERIIKAVGNSKQIALDVMEGEKKKMDDLIHSTTEYQRAKLRSFKRNDTRKEMWGKGKAALSAAASDTDAVMEDEDGDAQGGANLDEEGDEE